MKELLCSVALLLAVGATCGSIVGQEYEERPRSARRPIVTLKTGTKVTPSVVPANVVNKDGDELVRVAPDTASVSGSEAASNDANTVKSPVTPANTNPSVASSLNSATLLGTTTDEARSNLSTEPTPINSPEPITGTASAASSAAAPALAAPLTSIYRIGEGDILDIRILNYEVQSASTLYTVLGGILEYPLVGDPLPVTGLTTDEIDERLTAELKRREVFESPQVVVSVRDYVSHIATVTGMVENPGAKILRREALPLYVVLAEAVPRSEAGQVLITTPGTGASRTIDLADVVASNTLVHAGDVLRVMVRPPQFFYIGGEVGAPGQKGFHAGLTLTQAVLAAGGTVRGSNVRVRVARQGQDGRLVSSEYNLKDIEAGKIPDPALQAGDRIELTRK